ncbi:unnamed protein product [Arabidopsis arenosa]|uniref:Receptor-like serine/threonine-protein kinase n=1 Tax=Arabidopsis arenosa TaxID=38785 RepID=A0A8S2ANM9_ARAAE|nr:unnamed protein product [Arabidopsis arenosa]
MMMTMTRSVPHGNHFHTFFFLFFQLFVLITSIASYDSTFSPTRPLRITENETIVSPKGIFELGFFKPATRFQERDRWYLGIWYKRFATRVVWVANRDNPLSSSIGTLKVDNSNIVFLDHSGRVTWTTNLTKNMINNQLLVAELLDNGNFVLRYSNSSSYSWQSFDFPTDTLLPGMKLGWDRKTNINRRLRSWKSVDDPSNGDYIYKIEIRNLPESFIFKKNSPIYRSGPWNKVILSGSSTAIQVSPYATINLTETSEEVTYSFDINNNSFYSVLEMNYDGLLRRWVWTPTAQKWTLPFKIPRDQCDNYSECGPNSYCDMTTTPICNCLQGFQPRDQEAWEFKELTGGCVRKSQMRCVGNGFLHLTKMKLPDTKTTIVDTTIGLEECKARCLMVMDCNCTAFANTDMQNGGWGCVMWTGDLVDLRIYRPQGQDLYVKLVAADLGEKRRMNKKTIIGSTVGGCLLLLLSFIIICFWTRRKKRARTAANVSQERNRDLKINTTEDWGSKRMDFDVISTATNHFSELNKLGKGGFGIVYKGRLCDGQEIAVKRLSKMSPIGVDGFAVEAKLIALVQHVNVIRLIGFCYNADEKILVYEFLENSSLDTYLFDFLHLNDGSTLLSYMWNHWSQGNGLEIIDPAIKDSSSSVLSSQQILRCVQIGLMCVQELPEDRPTMSSVGLMLGRETEAIPQPK